MYAWETRKINQDFTPRPKHGGVSLCPGGSRVSQRLRRIAGANFFMVKRFHDTEIWKQDWFLEIENEYRTLWLYIKDTCDHAGIWKPEKKFVEFITGKPMNLETALKTFNNGKERVKILPNGRWLLPDFISFQYGGSLNPDNRVHKSILKLLDVNEVKLTSIRGLIDPKDSPKDKDKDSVDVKTLGERVVEREEYAPPDKTKDPVGAMVFAYKLLKGVKADDRKWDKRFWVRWVKDAKEIVTSIGEINDAISFLQHHAEKLQGANYSWNLHTIADRAVEWKARQANVATHSAGVRSANPDNGPNQ